MKVIDLLNKIANGEEVPDEIKCCSNHYYYDETDDNEVARYKDKGTNWMIDECYLNDEVEIIEEDKKIEKLNQYIYTNSLNYQTCNIMFEKTVNKINEIIDHINKE